MTAGFAFYLGTPLARALRDLLAQLEQRLALSAPLDVYLAGGMAVHLYTAGRVTGDVDAEFGGRVWLPSDLMVEAQLDDGTRKLLHFDSNYNSTFALMHEDYRDDAVSLDLGIPNVRLHVLSPTDLAVSKIARFSGADRADIAALVGAGLTSADAIEERATSALPGFIGGEQMLRYNIRDAVALARSVQDAGPAERPSGP